MITMKIAFRKKIGFVLDWQCVKNEERNETLSVGTCTGDWSEWMSHEPEHGKHYPYGPVGPASKGDDETRDRILFKNMGTRFLAAQARIKADYEFPDNTEFAK